MFGVHYKLLIVVVSRGINRYILAYIHTEKSIYKWILVGYEVCSRGNASMQLRVRRKRIVCNRKR